MKFFQTELKTSCFDLVQVNYKFIDNCKLVSLLLLSCKLIKWNFDVFYDVYWRIFKNRKGKYKILQ